VSVRFSGCGPQNNYVRAQGSIDFGEAVQRVSGEAVGTVIAYASAA
jgi:hypothetical protein